MNVESILRGKGREVATIRGDARVGEAVDMLCRYRIGALVVSDDGATVDGILSERDLVLASPTGAASCCRARWSR